jgi:hypothetical protein
MSATRRRRQLMTYSKALACSLLALALTLPEDLAFAGKCPGDPKCKDYKPPAEKPKPPAASKPVKPKPVQGNEPDCHDGAGKPQAC